MAIRRRKKTADSNNGDNQTTVTDQKLDEKLTDLWNKASTEGVTLEEYENYIDGLPRYVQNSAWKKAVYFCFNQFIKTFDCLWTIVLLCVTVFIVVALSDTLKGLIFTHGHSRIYDVVRVMRLAYVAVHPYLLLDFSRHCLIANPLANDTVKCPCIQHEYPIAVEYNPSLRTELLANSTYYTYLIRNVINVTEDYGRNTLAKMYENEGSLPEPCVVSDTTIEYRKLGTDESYWNSLKSRPKPWSYMWHECPNTMPSIQSLLPNVGHLLKDSNLTETHHYYILSSQWSPTYPIFCEDDKQLLVLLEGSLQIKLDSSDHCAELCIMSGGNTLYTISQGDAVLYNPNYWVVSDKTWSNTSFGVASCLKYD